MILQRRRRRTILVVLIIILIIVFIISRRDNRTASSEQNEPRSDSSSAITSTGEQVLSVSTSEGDRPYLLHIPNSYTKETPVPLVLFYHGGGGDMRQAKTYEFQDKADKEGFAVAFLNGNSAFPGGRLATWNAGSCCGRAVEKNIDDVDYTKLVLADISTKIKVDEARIYATGMSNGGMMAHLLACEMADTFAAVASVTGTDGTSSCNPSETIPVLQIHAINDTHVLFNGGAGEDAFDENIKEKVTEFISVPETISRWVTRNDVLPTPKRTLEVAGAYCDEYADASGLSVVKLCVTEDGKHSWPGSTEVTRSGAVPSTAIVANDVIWDFFAANTR